MNKNKTALTTFLQELGLMLLAEMPIQDAIQKATDKSRGRILASLKPDEREIYLASRNVIIEFATQLTKCESLEMLSKILEIIQGINRGEITEYELVENRILDEKAS